MIPEHEITSLPAKVLAAYPTQYFIETGTNTGKGVDLALAHRPAYRAVWSVDTDFGLVTAVRKRLIDAPAVIWSGPSPEFLATVLRNIPGRAFIYLDAHTIDQNPLLAELAAIAAADLHPDHVVAVDDVRMFGRRDMPGWRPINWTNVTAALYAINPSYTFRRWDTCNGLGDLLVASRTHPERS